MAGSGEETEPEWIKRVKSEGSVPCMKKKKSNNCKNTWTTPSPNTFMVRGPKYFHDKVKIPAGDYLLKPLGFDWIKGPKKLSEILNQPSHRIRKVLDENFQTDDGTKPFVWAFNLQLPHKENYSAVAYFVNTEPILEGSLMDQFLKGDDVLKKSKLKLIANIVKGPWIVRKAVGEQAICVIGRALSCKYVSGVNFMEVDIDIGSSMVASAIVHLAFGYVTTLTVDLAFLIESQSESELPEKLLGAVRFSELQPDSAASIELFSSSSSSFSSASSSSGNINDQTSSVERSSWWKSIGNGFSNLLNQDTTTNMNQKQ